MCYFCFSLCSFYTRLNGNKLFKKVLKKVLTEGKKSSKIKKYQAEHMKNKLYRKCIISNVSTVKKVSNELLIFLLKKNKKKSKKY